MEWVLAVFAAMSQFGITYLGFHVSAHPPRPEQVKRYTLAFLILGGLGVLAVLGTAWTASVEQTALHAELRQVTGADNLVWFHANLDVETNRGFQLVTTGRGSIAGGSYYIVPASAVDVRHPDYRKGRSEQFLALHSGMAMNEFLAPGEWRIEFVALTTGHYHQLLTISKTEDGKWIQKTKVIRADKEIPLESKS